MKQYEAVEVISKSIIADQLCDAIYLKGSLARGTEDEYSNVDLYVIVNDVNYDKFVGNCLDYLNSYQPIIYSRIESSKVICVYKNVLIVNLNILRYDELNYLDDMVVIDDPKHLLDDYKKIPLSYSPEEIGELINSFCLKSLEFYNAYCRGDYMYSLYLANHLIKYLGTFIRCFFEPEYAKLSLKLFQNNIDTESNSKFMRIVNLLRIDTVLECVKMMFILHDSYINLIPINFAEFINFDFYIFTKKQIMSIM